MVEINSENFESIYGEYGKSIYRYFYFRTSSEETAEDLTATLFTNLWKKVKGGLEVKNTKAFIYTMAHGLLVDHYRKAKSQISISLELVNPFKMMAPDKTETGMVVDDEHKTLLRHLDKLRDDYKNILILYYIEEVRIAQIAQMLNKKEATVRVTIHRAVDQLKKVYEKI